MQSVLALDFILFFYFLALAKMWGGGRGGGGGEENGNDSTKSQKCPALVGQGLTAIRYFSCAFLDLEIADRPQRVEATA